MIQVLILQIKIPRQPPVRGVTQQGVQPPATQPTMSKTKPILQILLFPPVTSQTVRVFHKMLRVKVAVAHMCK